MITTTTNEIVELQENSYTSGVYGKRHLALVRGQGALLWDADGREYVDCAGGHGVANIGHGRVEIAEALADQARRLITCPEIFYNDRRAELLTRLAQITPVGLDHFFLCNSGTEAVEGALKFARLATGRTNILATLRGFHGRTMGALSATWERAYREPFAPLVPGISHLRFNDLAAAEAGINEETAAVLIELVQGEGGVHPATQEYVSGLARLCHDRGALLIIDEVQTGFGRTGSMFACEHYELEPDILCMAKAIAGGVPMGAIALGPRVMESDRITRGAHGSTFGGNPLACAAALATLEILEREGLPARAARLGDEALQRLRQIESPLIREVRGQGLLLGIELRQRAQPYLEALLDRGILALPAGPNVLRLLPPLVITEDQLDHVITTLEELLTGNQNHPTIDTSLSTTRLKSMSTEQDEIQLLQRMLEIPSLSRQERALASFLAQQGQDLGLETEIDAVGSLIATALPATPEHQQYDPIILLGHMDTVPGKIPVRIENGLLYGRGAVDAKGPLAAFLCATARLSGLGKLQRPIIVIGAVEEEAATSRGARAVVDRYRPAACIIGEPSSSRAVTLGYKGRLLLEYRLEQEVSHSAGPRSGIGEYASNFWQKIRTQADEWNREHADNSTFAALLPSLREIVSEHDGLYERVRCSIGYRLPPSYDTAALRSWLEELAATDGAILRFSGEEEAFQSPRTTQLARTFTKAIRQTGSQPSFKLKTGTSDMNVVGPHWGNTIVAYGPGDSSLDHTPNEHIEISEYLHAIEVLELVLSELAESNEERP